MEECYCVKCKKKVNGEGEIVETSNGRKMFKGKCEECGTTICKFLKGGSD